MTGSSRQDPAFAQYGMFIDINEFGSCSAAVPLRTGYRALGGWSLSQRQRSTTPSAGDPGSPRLAAR